MTRRGAGAAVALALAALFAARPGPAPAAPPTDDAGPFGAALVAAEKSLADGRLDEARREVDRALERDGASARAWDVLARWAAAAKDADEGAYALHREYALLVAQKAPRPEVAALRKRLEAADPVAKDLLALDATFLDRLLALAVEYEKAKRPHGAIGAYREALSIAPDRQDVADAIARVASAPDPSLADAAKPKDLLADVSEEWIRRHDAEHATWETRARLERANYVTETDAGYAVLVRSAEAMEQMNAFYRRFFRYGTEKDGKAVPRIALHIFRSHDEYLRLGKGPPVSWSGGHFTGDSVETAVGDGGFEAMVGTLFHEAAHQFVSLATNAAGWLNEGLASFFEGCRILSNGTVSMNLPANHRLFPLVERMSRGWMASAADGIDASNPSASNPPKAPTFRIVLENEYEWGPAWYAPTWGVVYFLWNYQDPSDGRFLYRDAFHQFVDASGGKSGKAAIRTFEEVVLGHPEAPTRGIPEAKASRVRLAKTVDDLDDVWKAWATALRDEQSGSVPPPPRPRLQWARNAIVRKAYEDATEHFEKGLERSPQDVDLLVEFADHLAEHSGNRDRASTLAATAISVLEAAAEPDAKRIAAIRARLDRWDAKRATLDRVHDDLWAAAKALADRYAAAGEPLMTMHVCRTFGGEAGSRALAALFEDAVRRSGKTLARWQVAYDERDLAGWAPDPEKVFSPYGTLLRSRFGAYRPAVYDTRFLVYDTVTSGDFSFEAEVHAEKGKNGLCGLLFGRKSATSFHAVVWFPEGWVDLASFLGAAAPKTWRHNPLKPSADPWRRLRVDVTGTAVDVWVDGEPVASEDFGDLDVLRGGIGLVTGVGEAEFREVRYLARPRNDPGARIERAVRLEKAKATGAPVGGSWVGLVPAFPRVAAWVQGRRESWAEKGPVPTLLVLWSRRQNDLIPLDAWLGDLARRRADVGLEVVAVCEGDKPSRVSDYLAAHPFPGAVGIDVRDDTKPGEGETFDAYFVGKRFDLPRLVLLDVDQRVVWEGGPGFDVGKSWKAGDPSYLDTPLDTLAAKRRLADLKAWLRDWGAAGGRGAVRAGAPTAEVGRLLAASRPLPGDVVPEVAWAQERLKSLDAALAAFDKTADAIAAQGAEPATAVLAAWAAAVGKPVDPNKVHGVRRAAASANASAWATALAAVERARKAVAGGAEAVPTVSAALGKLAPLPGRFPKALVDRLQAAVDAGDGAAASRALDGAADLPATWLAAEFLRF